MIVAHYPNPNKKPVHKDTYLSNYPPEAVKGAIAKAIPVTEWIRRNNIVKTKAAECSFKSDDVVYAYSKKLSDETGPCKVLGICANYSEMFDKEWPTTDSPFIVLVQPFKSGTSPITATANYFTKTEPK